MKSILEIYENALGHTLNQNKSEVTFSGNICVKDRNRLAASMGVRLAIDSYKYLGLPSMVGRNKKSTFGYVKDRVWKHITSWGSSTLSKSGKEVLIKSVLQSIPSQVMSIYLPPHSLCDEIEIMINSYWRGSSGANSKGIKWISWEKLTCSKSQGGIGFINLHSFNLAMLVKLAWKLVNNPEALLSKFLKAKYFPTSCFLDVEQLTIPVKYTRRSLWNLGRF